MPTLQRASGEAASDPPARPAGEVGGATPRVLVVDDNPDNLELLVAILEGQQYRVTTATSGEAALAAVAAAPPALILLDVILPDLDGHEVARRLKHDTALPFIPIILVTAKSELRDKIYGLEQGADDFLSKPVNSAELIARVRALLRLKQAQDDLRQRHEELRLLHQQLRDSEEMRQNLVQMITHDLRGPLTGLLGALELIEDGSLGPLTADQQTFTRQALHNCQTLNDMVADLLDVYRLEAGHVELAYAPLAMHQLAALACLQVQGAIAGKKLRLQNAIAPDLPPIAGDQDKLVRVLANLLNNAFKYTNQGTITLAAAVGPDNGYGSAAPGEGQPPQRHQQYLVVQVQDTGVGIPAAVRGQIFQKFYRVRDPVPGGVIRGAGLGLHFCKHVVEAHGGNIWVDPRPDGQPGSVFTFSVPVYPGPAARESP
ncbi:MAG TPA: response regulator [Chloroflexia bacterium]|nr:response regulator [Chloroflexia bacterium]